MTDLERILVLWRELEAAGADYVLATVVEVEGSSYRKPGACMLLAPDGRRVGTVSGGCLEAQVAQRAWWLTVDGPIIQRYSTLEDDGDLPYGSGCGGVIYLLLERRTTAAPLLHVLEQAFTRRIPIAVANILEGSRLGRRAFAGLTLPNPGERAPSFSSSPEKLANSEPISPDPELQELANSAFNQGSSMERRISIQGTNLRAWANFRAARPGLWIFGAGDDAQPILRLAREMGWYVTVADGRSHLTTRERFPAADGLHVLSPTAQPADQAGNSPPALANLRPHDAAVLMTHSFEQDSHILALLLTLDFQLAYIGVLGPQRRTLELLAEAARLLNLPASAAQTERWLDQLHTPMGLDLGAESPETIALSVIAEVQKSLTAATALPLRQVRAHAVTRA
ncbi:MAG: XdhC family protein [Terracidiphilus sp.]|jgi:xanthine/CO dehydrogenase XdhC/CoxF family maturation factor